MTPEFPIDPRLKNLDNELIKIVYQEYQKNIDLVAIHLRDARNMWYGANQVDGDRVLGKGALLLASAALESNLVYLSGVAVKIAEQRPRTLNPAQIRYLKGVEEYVNENGKVAERSARQSLSERLQIVPNLLARVIGRTYALPRRSAGVRKLVRTIQRRDALIHPRWDRYLPRVGRWEAAEAIDGVELYLDTISKALHPYLVGYFPFLYTIPGSDHHEVAVGHRTFGKRGPKDRVSTMEEVGIREVLLNEWIDAVMLVHLAFDHDCEGDSDGSMLTRAALVLLYAMIDAHLSVVAQWKMREKLDAFTEAEILFLNEYAVGVGHDGEVWIGEDHQNFKQRIKAVPVILSRRVDLAEENIDLGKEWGKHLLDGHQLRSKVMHSSFGNPLPRVTKQELARYTRAVFSYFEELATKLPTTFRYVETLLENREDLEKRFTA
jgi:hypothetical protein